MPETPSTTILTVGHSTHPLEEFLDLLAAGGVRVVADVRRLPGSRRYPWFDQEALAASLADAGIGYTRIAGLTGRRGRRREVPDEVNGFWTNRSFHNYADHALGAEFASGLEELIGIADQRHPVAVMCSEAVWWRCHRRIVADHLLARGVPVGHLLPGGRIDAAELTRRAVVAEGLVTYPRTDSPASAAEIRRPR